MAETSLRPIVLPRPALPRARSLADALRRRRTTREISARALPLSRLSDLLWAAAGINRKRGPFGLVGRTAASASNSQEIDVYVARKEGVYRYDAERHQLIPVAAADVRRYAIGAGQASSGDEAPVRLIYVVDLDRLAFTAGYMEPGLRDPETQRAYAHIDTGLIAANVYLYAAAVGLAAWFHNCDRAQLCTLLRLGKRQRPLFAQTIGYPARRKKTS